MTYLPHLERRRAEILEERKKKKGGGGRPQNFGAHGRYGSEAEVDAGVATILAWTKPPPDLVALLKTKGGFTLDPAIGQPVTSGVAVAVEGHTKIMKAADFMGGKGQQFVRDYIHKMAKAKPSADIKVGGWYDTENDEIVLDWTEVFPDRASGIKAGRLRNQMAVYDLGTNEEIPTGGTGDRERILSEQAGETRDARRHPAEQADERDDGRGAGSAGRFPVSGDGGQARPHPEGLSLDDELELFEFRKTSSTSSGPTVQTAQALSLDDELALFEFRKASGLKKGGGGRPQAYGEHGKYGKTYIAAVSGATVKATVSVDLTMSALPEDVQAKSTAQLTQSLGISFEEGVEHLVSMAEAAGARGGLAGRDWYPIARNQAVAVAVRNDIDPQIGIAITAAMSPGTKWEENIRNATAIMSTRSQLDDPIDPQFIEATNTWAEREDKTTKKPNSPHRAEAGETLAQLYKKDPHLAAVYAAKKTNASAGYSYDNFYKGMDLVVANDPAVIDRTLNGAKVRSFYNNISEPASTAGSVTIDVHMQRAMANDLDSTTPQQKHERTNLIKKRSSSITGSPSYAGASLGAMPVMADITREATRRFNEGHRTNLLPSEFQAVVWTEQITQFPPQTVEAILAAPAPELVPA